MISIQTYDRYDNKFDFLEGSRDEMDMRSGISLLEMIFAIVIIGVAFAVVPRIIMVANRSMQLSIKEDGLYNAVALAGHIINLSWDQQTIDTNGKILDAGGVPCVDNRRRGEFVGSMRICSDKTPDDTAESDYQDVDDYDGYSDTTTGGRVIYDRAVSVGRDKDLKAISVTVSTTDQRVGRAFVGHIRYESYNLGQVQVPRRACGN